MLRLKGTLKKEIKVYTEEKEVKNEFSHHYLEPRNVKCPAKVGANLSMKLSGDFQSVGISVSAEIPVEACEEEVLRGQEYALELCGKTILNEIEGLKKLFSRARSEFENSASEV